MHLIKMMLQAGVQKTLILVEMAKSPSKSIRNFINSVFWGVSDKCCSRILEKKTLV